MKNLLLPKFYRYIIYRLYSWRMKSNDDTPISTVVITITFIHFIQAILLSILFIKLDPVFLPVIKQSKGAVYAFFLGFAGIYYLLVYNKQRWQGYIQEFQDESIEKRSQRNWTYYLFTLGSIVLFFFVLVLAIVSDV